MAKKLRMVLSLDEFDEDMIQLSVSHSGMGTDEIIGIAPWQEKMIIATRYRILVLDRDRHMEVQLQEAMNFSCDVGRALAQREDQIVRDGTEQLVRYTGMSPGYASDPTLQELVRRIRRP